MGLADDVGSLVRSKPLTVDAILAALDERDRDALLVVLRDRAYSHRQIAAWLTDNGHPIGKTGIEGWRSRNEWGG